MRRRASVLVVLAVAISGCSGSGDEPISSAVPTELSTLPPATTASPTGAPRDSPESTTAAPPDDVAPVQTTTTSAAPTTAPNELGPNRSPLTGLEVDDESVLDRRVIAVKIDNHRRARPQSGIPEAEVVYELLVEGGLTRFLALYQSTDSDYVGPIRSVRSTELTFLPSLGAVLQTATGWEPVLDQAREAGVNYISITRATTWRIDDRNAPHNLYGDTSLMRRVSDNRDWPDDPPQPIFDFGAPPSPAGAAERVVLSWSGGSRIVWEFDGARYLRFHGDTPHEWLTESGDTGQIAFDTLVVLVVDREDSISDPSFRTLGTGEAIVFHGGEAFTGSWERPAVDAPFSLLLEDGQLLSVPPGRIWISLFPSNRPVDFD